MPRISQLPSLTTADNSDEIAIVDVSASVTKKITRGELLKAPLPNNAVTTASITNGAVTASKIDFATLLASLNLVSSKGTLTNVTATLGQMAGISGSITVASPTKVRITLSGNLTVGQANASMQIDVRDGAAVVMTGNKESNNPGFGLTYTRIKVIELTPGTHNFTVWARMAAGTSGQFAINNDADLMIDLVAN